MYHQKLSDFHPFLPRFVHSSPLLSHSYRFPNYPRFFIYTRCSGITLLVAFWDPSNSRLLSSQPAFSQTNRVPTATGLPLCEYRILSETTHTLQATQKISLLDSCQSRDSNPELVCFSILLHVDTIAHTGLATPRSPIGIHAPG